MEINAFYDTHSKNQFINKDYLVNKKIIGDNEIDIFISRLVSLGLIDYSRNNAFDEMAITRLPACVTYFEKKNDAAHQAAFAKVTSIISLIISTLSAATVILNFIWQNFVGKQP